MNTTAKREFVAMVQRGQGTQAVTIEAHTKEGAIRRLLMLGYSRVIWCEPN